MRRAHRSLGARAAAAALLCCVLAGPSRPVRAEALPSPASRAAADVVLAPADVGPDFVVASSGQATEQGFSVFRQNLVRGGGSAFLAPDGIFFVRSVAGVISNPARADGDFNLLAEAILAGLEEVPVSLGADRVRGGVAWGAGPFDASTRLVLFRAGNTLGYVQVVSYEAPTHMDDVVRLAEVMVTRSRQ
jgi:hypothetical protein